MFTLTPVCSIQSVCIAKTQGLPGEMLSKVVVSQFLEVFKTQLDTALNSLLLVGMD